VSQAIERIILGTAQLGLSYGVRRAEPPLTQREAEEVLDAAWTAGVRAFDTAAAYGAAPLRLRNWLRSRRFEDSAEIVTKARARATADETAGAIRTFERVAMLTVLAHDPIDVDQWQVFASAVSDARGSAPAARVGVSVYTPAEAAAATSLPRCSVVQAPFSVVDRRVLDVVRPDGGWQLHARSIFLQGILLQAPALAEARVPGAGRFAALVQQEAAGAGLRVAAFLISMALHLLPTTSRIVLGAESPAQIEEWIEALDGVSRRIAKPLQVIEQEIGQSASASVIDPRTWTS
jgi:aryl-alcohol dehydrogenase-like predicted oxidoreductase